MTSFGESVYFSTYFLMVNLGIKLNMIYQFPRLCISIRSYSIKHKDLLVMQIIFFFARSVIEQRYICSSINIAKKKLKPGAAVIYMQSTTRTQFKSFYGTVTPFLL